MHLQKVDYAVTNLNDLTKYIYNIMYSKLKYAQEL